MNGNYKANESGSETGGKNDFFANRRETIERYKRKLQNSIGSVKEDFFNKLYKFIGFNIICTLIIICAFIVISIYVPNKDVYFSSFQYVIVVMLVIMNLAMFYANKMG